MTSKVMWAETGKELGKGAYESANMWAKIVREMLHMKCSDKNVITTPGIPAEFVQLALVQQGVKDNIEAHGVDVGTGVTGGVKRGAKTFD